MSMKDEQFASLLKTKDFLFDLLDPKKRPKTQKEMRGRVKACLRHYPFLEASGKPMFSSN